MLEISYLHIDFPIGLEISRNKKNPEKINLLKFFIFMIESLKNNSIISSAKLVPKQQESIVPMATLPNVFKNRQFVD